MKGFIKLNDVTYAALILFVPKPNGSKLRFYVDYYKFNALTVKDRYLLLLIEETLSKLDTAKVFAKLDIWQAFYYLRIALDLRLLTTFRTKYKAYKYKVLPFKLVNGPFIF